MKKSWIALILISIFMIQSIEPSSNKVEEMKASLVRKFLDWWEEPNSQENLDQKLSQAINENQISIVNALLNHGANVNGSYNGIPSPLIEALLNDNASYELIKLLLDRGAKVNEPYSFQGFETYTFLPLTMAIKKKQSLKIIELLLKYGANPDLKDYDGKTALNYARTWATHAEPKEKPYWSEVIKLLESYDAMEIVDVSSFPTSKPSLPTLSELYNEAAGEPMAEVINNLTLNQFGWIEQQYYHRITQEKYLQFKKGNEKPLRKFIFNTIYDQEQGKMGIIKNLFKSDEYFYALVRHLAQTDQEKQKAQDIISTQRANTAFYEKENKEFNKLYFAKESKPAYPEFENTQTTSKKEQA